MRELERRDPLLGAGVGVEEEQGGGKNLPARQACSDIIKPVASLAGAGSRCWGAMGVSTPSRIRTPGQGATELRGHYTRKVPSAFPTLLLQATGELGNPGKGSSDWSKCLSVWWEGPNPSYSASLPRGTYNW